MSIIHARKKNNGEVAYRLWSSTVERYITGEMTKREICKEVLIEKINDAIDSYHREIDNRITRALNTGTSDMIGESKGFNSEWWEDERK